MPSGNQRGGALLVGLLLLFAGVLALEVMLLEDWRLGVKQQARSQPQAEQAQRSEFWRPPEDLLALGAIAAMVERPLFLPTRRPPEPLPKKQPTKKPKKKAGKLALKLTSTIITAGSAAAIFAEKGSKNTLLMHHGDKYKGWELILILPEGVVFESDSRQRQLHVRPSGPPQSGKQSAINEWRLQPSLAVGFVAIA